MAIGVSLALSAQQSTLVELNGNWKFSKGDNMKWARPGFDDKKWDNAIVPTWDWEKGYDGYGWFRKDFLLQEKETYFFNLGQADDDCEVYFNGVLLPLYVSRKPKNDNADTSHYNQWKKYRSYYIPRKLVNAGKKNTLAIRVWDTDAEGGIRYGSVYISNTVFYNRLPVQLEGNWLKKDGSNEWLIGLYDNKVVYKSEMWEYGAITEKDGGYSITLKNNSKTEHLRITDDNGSGDYFIGADEEHMELCSLHETYKLAADTAAVKQAYLHPGRGSGKGFYRGWIKGYTSAMGNELYIQVSTPFSNSERSGTDMAETTYTQMDVTTTINSDGSFSADMGNLSGPATAYLRGMRIAATPVYLEPDKSVFQVVDPEEFKIYVTPEYYARERRTMYMGDLAMENKLQLYIDQLLNAPDNGRDVWDRFTYTAALYAGSGRVSDEMMNNVVYCIARKCKQYNDVAALRRAKIWAAKVVLSTPDSHVYNNTFNIVLQELGEHLEGLEYLVKALSIAEKDNKQDFVKAYKQSIKEYISEMLK
jgi:hypothetical protein